MIQNYFESRYKELQDQEITRINYYKKQTDGNETEYTVINPGD